MKRYITFEAAFLDDREEQQAGYISEHTNLMRNHHTQDMILTHKAYARGYEDGYDAACMDLTDDDLGSTYDSQEAAI